MNSNCSGGLDTKGWEVEIEDGQGAAVDLSTCRIDVGANKAQWEVKQRVAIQIYTLECDKYLDLDLKVRNSPYMVYPEELDHSDDRWYNETLHP
jgi:hypothetical protein